jgi:hypothetical protein
MSATTPAADPTALLRRRVYVLVTAVATALAAGRVLSTERVYEPHLAPPPGAPIEKGDGRYQAWPGQRPAPVPTFGSNDRSRWDTVRALVDGGTFVIGRRDPDVIRRTAVGGLAAPDALQAAVLLEAGYANRTDDKQKIANTGVVFEDGWFTIDKVLHPERLEYLSSKPPLLTVLMAGEYWLLKHTLGWSLTGQTNEVVRTGLLTFNVLPFALYLWLLSRLAERFGTTDWGRLFVVTAAAFGTLLTPFLTTFNNHTPAAFAALVALYAGLRAGFPREAGPRKSEGERGAGIGATEAGLSTQYSVLSTQYSPAPPPATPPARGAAGWFLLAGAAAFYRRLAAALRDGAAGWFLLAGAAAGFLINCELPGAAFAAALGLALLWRAPARTLLWFTPPLLLFVAAFVALNYLATGQFGPVYEKLDTPWYQYEGSVWNAVHPGEGRGIEYAKFEESRWAYAFHLLLGHHGWFSLTPVNLLGAAGMAAGAAHLWKRWARRKDSGGPGAAWDVTAAGGLVVSVVVFIFYAFWVETANYGGWTSAPRWLLWLTPLWLAAMFPAADRLGRRRWGRALCVVLLVLSAASAAYPAWNPWRHPWLYNWMEYNRWIDY